MALLLGVILLLISFSFSGPHFDFFLKRELQRTDLNLLSLRKVKVLTYEGKVEVRSSSDMPFLSTKARFVEAPYRVVFSVDFQRNSTYGFYLLNGQGFSFRSYSGQRIYVFPYNGSFVLEGGCSPSGSSFVCTGDDVRISFTSNGDKGRLVLMSDTDLIGGLNAPGIEHYRLGTGAFLSGLDGSGVVVAVVDSGINWCHSAFRDSEGRTRILYYYDAVSDVELSSEDIDTKIGQGDCGYDVIGHGTSVAGVIAGDEEPYKGIAPGADLIVVKVDDRGIIDDTTLIQALNYLKNKRGDLKRPFVVNISLGMFVGPRDGTELLDRKVDEVSGSGFIVVSAMGNSGSGEVHASIDKLSSTVSVDVSSLVGDLIEGWYEEGMEIAVKFCQGSSCVSALPGEIKTGSIGSCSVTLDNSTLSSPLNGDGVFYVEFNCVGDFTLELTPMSGNGRVDLYLMNGSYFPGVSRFLNLVKKDSYGGVYGTVGSPASSKKAIAVGAFVSKPSSSNFSGESFKRLGKVASFSSRGPTRDGRIKPEIVSGGMWVWSASPDGSGFVPNAGTSFSAPVVTGLVALYLQAHPDATPEEVKEWLTSNAILDDPSFSERPNNTYGYGKAVWGGTFSVASGGGSGGCRTSGGSPFFVVALLLVVKLILGCAGVESSSKVSPRLRQALEKGEAPKKVVVLTKEGKVEVIELDGKKLEDLFQDKDVKYIDLPKKMEPLE